jgi:hypothetical protein
MIDSRVIYTYVPGSTLSLSASFPFLPTNMACSNQSIGMAAQVPVFKNFGCFQ